MKIMGTWWFKPWPFWDGENVTLLRGESWPPTRGWKGHGLNHLVYKIPTEFGLMTIPYGNHGYWWWPPGYRWFPHNTRSFQHRPVLQDSSAPFQGQSHGFPCRRSTSVNLNPKPAASGHQGFWASWNPGWLLLKTTKKESWFWNSK